MSLHPSPPRITFVVAAFVTNLRSRYVSDHITCATRFEILPGIYWRNFSVISAREEDVRERYFLLYEKKR